MPYHLRLLSIIISISLAYPAAYGQNTTLNKSCKQAEFACGECETQLQEDFNKLFDSILEKPIGAKRWSEANGTFTVKDDANIDDFIKKSLDLMKKNNPKGDNKLNMIVIGNSESLHGTTPGNPRVAIKSPDGEFWLTFNTDPNAPGYNSVEVMRWDGKSGSYKFQEISFAEKGQKGHVDLTGQKCARCHREPMRPNWDTYRSWSNVIPPRDDLVEKDKSGKIDVAGRAYINFLQDIEKAKKNPNTTRNKRLSYLEIPADGKADADKIKNIQKTVAKDGFFRVPHFPEKEELGNYSEKTAPKAGSSHLGFDQLMGQNTCQIANNLKKNPNFDKFKYAITGMIYCSAGDRDSVDWDEVKKYAPEQFQKEALAYFQNSPSLNLAKGKATPKNKDEVLNKIFQHTKAKHKAVDKAKYARGEKMLRMYSSLPGVKATNNDVKHVLTKTTFVGYPYTAVEDPGGVQSVPESDPGIISSMRYFLEPLGVKVGAWSMVNESNIGESTFSFSDQFFDMIKEQDSFKEVWKSLPGSTTQKCETLQEYSRKALEGKIGFEQGLVSANKYLDQICSKEDNNPAVVAERIKEDLGEKTCKVCHTTMHPHVAEIFGPNAVKSLNDSKNGEAFKEHVKKMLKEGRMPPGGFGIGANEKEKLENDRQRRETLIKYVDYVSGDRSDICESEDYDDAKTPVSSEIIKQMLKLNMEYKKKKGSQK